MVELLLTEDPAQINDIERRMLVRDIQNEMLGLGPLELLMADPTVSDILVNSYNQIYVERRGKLELTDVVFLRRQALAAHHRQDRFPRRPANRRIEPDGRCATAGRLARQRDHSADRAGRTDGVDPAVRGHTAEDGRSGQPLQIADARHGLDARGARQVENQHAHFRRHRFGQDDAAQHPFRIHPGNRTHRHDRRRGGTATAAGARRPAGNAPAEHRRQRRSHSTARWCATRCGCGPTASLSARCAAAKQWT